MQMERSDGKKRCCWANPKNERYIRYHDEEGVFLSMMMGSCFHSHIDANGLFIFALEEAIHKQSHG